MGNGRLGCAGDFAGFEWWGKPHPTAWFHVLGRGFAFRVQRVVSIYIGLGAGRRGSMAGGPPAPLVLGARMDADEGKWN